MQITIDDQLFEQAARLADTEEPSQIITLALREFIQRHEFPANNKSKHNLMDLCGSVSICEDYDYKALRIGSESQNEAEWKFENQSAIDGYNQFVEENGVFSDGVRVF